MTKIFEYRTLPLSIVVGLTDGSPKHPDAYLSDDADSRAFNSIIAEGFRWIRTDGDLAVFERCYEYPALESR